MALGFCCMTTMKDASVTPASASVASSVSTFPLCTGPSPRRLGSASPPPSLDVRDLERRVDAHLELGVRAGENRNRRSRSAPTENARLETGEAVATIRGTATAASWTNRPTSRARKREEKILAPTRRVAAWARDRGRGSRATASGTHSVLNATFMVTVRVCRVWGDVSLRRRASSSVAGPVAFRQRKRQRRPDGQILIFGDSDDVQKC